MPQRSSRKRKGAHGDDGSSKKPKRAKTVAKSVTLSDKNFKSIIVKIVGNNNVVNLTKNYVRDEKIRKFAQQSPNATSMPNSVIGELKSFIENTINIAVAKLDCQLNESFDDDYSHIERPPIVDYKDLGNVSALHIPLNKLYFSASAELLLETFELLKDLPVDELIEKQGDRLISYKLVSLQSELSSYLNLITQNLDSGRSSNRSLHDQVGETAMEFREVEEKLEQYFKDTTDMLVVAMEPDLNKRKPKDLENLKSSLVRAAKKQRPSKKYILLGIANNIRLLESFFSKSYSRRA